MRQGIYSVPIIYRSAQQVDSAPIPIIVGVLELSAAALPRPSWVVNGANCLRAFCAVYVCALSVHEYNLDCMYGQGAKAGNLASTTVRAALAPAIASIGPIIGILAALRRIVIFYATLNQQLWYCQPSWSTIMALKRLSSFQKGSLSAVDDFLPSGKESKRLVLRSRPTVTLEQMWLTCRREPGTQGDSALYYGGEAASRLGYERRHQNKPRWVLVGSPRSAAVVYGNGLGPPLCCHSVYAFISSEPPRQYSMH